MKSSGASSHYQLIFGALKFRNTALSHPEWLPYAFGNPLSSFKLVAGPLYTQTIAIQIPGLTDLQLVYCMLGIPANVPHLVLNDWSLVITLLFYVAH